MGLWDWIRSAFGGASPEPRSEPPSEPEPTIGPTADGNGPAERPEPELTSADAASEASKPPKKARKAKRAAARAERPKKPKKPKKGRAKGALGAPREERRRTVSAPATEPEGPSSLLPTPRAIIEPPPGFEPPPPPAPPPPPSSKKDEPSATSPPAPPSSARPTPAAPPADRGPSPRRRRDQETLAWILVPKLEGLLEEVDKVLAEADAPRATLVAARTKFTREWQSLRPIPQEHAERLTQAFDARRTTLNERIAVFPDPKVEEEAKNVAARNALIAQGEALVGLADIREAVNQAKGLQRQWRDAPRVSRDAIQPLNQRFRAAMDAVFARRDEQRNERLGKLGAFVTSAEALTRAQDPVRAAEAMKQLQAQWKATGGVRGEEGDALWNRFRGAADQVFERRRTHRQTQEEAALKARQALIEEANTLAGDAVEDPEEVVRGLHRRWRRLGHAPRDQADALWAAFREACDRLRNPPAVHPSELGDGQDALRFSPFAGIGDREP